MQLPFQGLVLLGESLVLNHDFTHFVSIFIRGVGLLKQALSRLYRLLGDPSEQQLPVKSYDWLVLGVNRRQNSRLVSLAELDLVVVEE